MADYKTILENDYPGVEVFTQSCLDPVFGPVQRAKRSLNGTLSDADKTIVKDIFIFGRSHNFTFGEMNFFDVTLQDKVDIARSRVTIQRAVRKSLDSYQAAIVIFHHQNNQERWRFSFINKGDGAKNTTPAKRYSYLCGKGRFCRTLADNLEKLQTIQGKRKLEDLTAVFSIEALTKDFFNRLFKWYDKWAVDVVRFPAGSGKNARLPAKLTDETKRENRQHLIRLITRLIFVWFLRQKEHLVPPWLFDIEELRKVLINFNPHSEKNGSYYNAVLQNLFFATLNCEIAERNFFDEADGRDGYSIKSRFRDHIDKPMIAVSHEEFVKKFETIPFLNGGLFDCLDRRDDSESQEYKDGFSRESTRAAFVPNCLFFGDTAPGGHEGLIDIFSQYNFTIEENTPQDIEIALDPELLGKVFENLLGTYNEETASTARNESGSFYTPREIVEYMVDTSLKEYFKGKLGGGSLPPAPTPLCGFSAPPSAGDTPATPPSTSTETSLDEKLDILFSYHAAEHDFEAGQVKLLMDAINNCKILDPACGSGAFPMGVLNKLTFIMEKLDPDNKLWEELQIQKATEETGEAFKIGNKSAREKRLKEISDVFELNKENYGRKLFLIENCIYGVDIQPIAIQISKLRFFISLIVDQKGSGTKENNYHVLPLPNLETKFVAANTLIGVERKQGVLASPEIDVKQKELLLIRHRHFSARNTDEKKALRKTDRKLSKELVGLLKQDGFYNPADAAQMAKWNPYSQTEASDFFDPWWMFGITGGFDIVIGNPPYFVYKNEHITALEVIKLQDYYPLTGSGKLNAYRAFIAKSLKNITKTSGIFCMIFQNSFLGDSFAAGLRKYIFDNHSILNIDSFPERDNVSKRVFTGVKMSVCILTCKTGEINNGFNFNMYSDKGFNREYTNKIKLSDIKLLYPKNLSIPLIKPEELSVLLKVYNISRIEIKAIEGEINMTFHKHLLSENNKNPEVLKGAAIQRYRISEKMSQGKHEYLNVPKYEKENRGIKTTHHNFERLVMQGITGVDDRRRLIFAPLPKNYYLANSCNYILVSSSEELKYLLGLFNSTLINWIFKKKSTNSNVNCYEVANLPIISTNPTQRSKIVAIVNKILAAKAADPKADTSTLERRIDEIVYSLYGLTEEEIKIVEERK